MTTARTMWGPFPATLVAAALPAVPMSSVAVAQDRQGPSFELAAGWVAFADDEIASEAVVGGSSRWHVLPRISVGPEVVYISGNDHSHLVVTGNVTCDLFALVRARRRRGSRPC